MLAFDPALGWLYVASESGEVIDYRDWHVPLGRRFRALKLWWVLRSYGATGLRLTDKTTLVDDLKNALRWSQRLVDRRVRTSPDASAAHNGQPSSCQASAAACQ